MPLENRGTVLYDTSDVEIGTAGNPMIVGQGSPALVANAWPILVTDGVDTAEVLTSAPGAGAAGLVVRIAGALAISEQRPATSTITSVNVTNVNTTLLALNANRLGALFWNDSAGTNVFIKLGATASTASFTVRLGGKSLYELQTPVYTGVIDAITAAGAASVLVTELTP